jgi:GxxExxY protein
MDINRYEELAKQIFLASLEVHKIMGPGLLESVYEMCLLRELQLRNISAESQVGIPLQFKGFDLVKEYKIDVLVENEIILELKSVDTILPVHQAQIISYLKLADKRMGFLINFNVPIIKNGFKRFVNNY